MPYTIRRNTGDIVMSYTIHRNTGDSDVIYYPQKYMRDSDVIYYPQKYRWHSDVIYYPQKYRWHSDVIYYPQKCRWNSDVIYYSQKCRWNSDVIYYPQKYMWHSDVIYYPKKYSSNSRGIGSDQVLILAGISIITLYLNVCGVCQLSYYYHLPKYLIEEYVERFIKLKTSQENRYVVIIMPHSILWDILLVKAFSSWMAEHSPYKCGLANCGLAVLVC